MTAISFKSVGELTVDTQLKTPPESLPIGISTPMMLGTGNDGIFKMHRNIGSQIADNLRNLILTDHGERLGLHDFGANLGPILFSYTSPDWETNAMMRIKAATGKFMPFVQLESFQLEIDNNDKESASATLVITVIYSVPTAAITDKAIKVFLRTGG